MNRFHNTNHLIQSLLDSCQSHSTIYKILYQHYTCFHPDQNDFCQLLLRIEKIIQKIPENTLIISIGESPSKMVAVMEHFELWKKKELQVFYLPVSKTVLHMNLSSFYKNMELFEGTKEDWKYFFIPRMKKNFSSEHVRNYHDFLKQRKMEEEFRYKMSKTNSIYFIDFLMYGNSFTAFFTYLWIPLLHEMNILYDHYDWNVVFFIDPENHHHRLAASLEFLFDAFFSQKQIIYLQDILSKKNATQITNFFMDFPVRCIQQIKAPFYRFPEKIPEKQEYIFLVNFLLLMIFLSPISSKISWNETKKKM